VEHQVWLAAAGPLLAFAVTFALTTVSAVRTEREVHDFISLALGRYVPAEVSRAVFRNVKLIHPERREVTLLYCDLEGFGGACAQLSPQDVAALLNAFLTEATGAVRETYGQVEYVGDSVIAFWGAPVRTDQHAQLACKTALALRALLEKRAAAWEKRFGRRVGFRVGLSTGEVVVGDLGSDFKANYTAIGDPVGRAARLERANRIYGTFVVADARTVELASDAFVFREIDRVAFRDEPQLLFELIAAREEVPRATASVLHEFQEGLALYRARRFQEALAHFARNGQDPVSALYVERCRECNDTPPGADWNAVGELRQAARRS
jgi:adenylate cyclase